MNQQCVVVEMRIVGYKKFFAVFILALWNIGVMAQHIVQISFESSEELSFYGKTEEIAGKPGNHDAIFFAEDAYAVLDGGQKLMEAEKAGVLCFESWIYREEDMIHGFIARQDGAFSVLVVPWDPSRINVGVWTESGYVSIDSESCLRSGLWQHVMVVIEHCDLRCYVDGKLIFNHKLETPMLSSENPVYLARAMHEGQLIGGLEAALDEIRISGTVPTEDYINRVMARCTENFDATQTVIGLPPEIARPVNPTPQSTPVRVERTPETVTVENSYYRAVFAVKPNLYLQTLENKYGNVDCLLPAGSPLFAVAVDDKQIDAWAFEVQSWEEQVTADGIELKFQLSAPAENLGAEVTVECTSGRDIRLDFRLFNQGAARTIQLTAPMVENISIGSDFTENYYFWPMLTGWVGKNSFELGMTYGSRCWLQLSDVFSPAHGVGLALSGRDTSGEVKGIVVRKTRKDGRIGVDYNMLFLPRKKAVSPFADDSIGLAMANIFPPKLLPSGAVRDVPSAVLSVHPGDVLEVLKDYRQWVKTWFRHGEMPESIRDDFNIVAVHRFAGNRGFEKGFGHTPGKFSLLDKIHPDKRDHHLQLAMWWKEHHPGEIASGEGDYEYDDTLGGREAMAAEIQALADQGTYTSLYLCSRQAGNDSEVAQHKNLAFYPLEGQRANDWGSFNPCTHAHQWQDMLTEKYARLAADLPVTGLYLDTSAEVLFCSNPGHPHAENLVDDQLRLLQKIDKAIKGAKPGAFLFTEFMGSEFFGQYIDACWIQTFANPYAVSFNNYDLDFARFVLPEVKYFEWGMSETTFEVDSRRLFFNGVGGSRGDLTDAQNLRYAELSNTLREVSRCLATNSPEPFAASAAKNVYVNHFPLADRAVWTLYNKTGKAFAGEVFPLPADFERYRYVELLTDRIVTAENGNAVVELDKDEVALVAQFDPVMHVTENPDGWKILLNEKFKPSEMTLSVVAGMRDSAEYETVLTVQDQQALVLREQFGNKRLIIKLRAGYELVDELVIEPVQD